MTYKFVEGLTVADVAFRASSSNLALVFKDAAEAFIAAQIANPRSVRSIKEKKFTIKADNVEELMFKFLDELVFLKDRYQLLLRVDLIEIEADSDGKKWVAKGVLIGEKVDTKRHETLAEVKAVTMHHFSVKKMGKLWKAVVVLDV